MFDVDSRLKITALYMIGTSDGALPRAHLFDFFMQNGLLDFFGTNELIGTLSESGMVNFISDATRVFLELTQAGKEALEALNSSVSDLAKELTKDYFRQNRLKIRDEQSLKAFPHMKADKTGEVLLLICEKGQNLLEIKLVCPDFKTADKIAKDWKTKAGDIYRDLLLALIG